MPKSNKVYAVAAGNATGLFNTWDECQKQVKGVKGAKFKSFSTREEALEYLAKNEAGTQKRTMSNAAEEAPQEQQDGAAKRPRKTNTNIIPFPCIYVRITVMFDGGSRGNPGVAGAGAFVQSVYSQVLHAQEEARQFQNRRTVKIRHYLGSQNGGVTNNRAEYQGLCSGLERAVTESRKLVESLSTVSNIVLQCLVEGDSQLVIKQIMGEYACRHANLQPCKVRADEHIAELQSLESPGKVKVDIMFNHVLREFNKEADALGNEAMDAKRSWVTVTNDDGEEGEQEEYHYFWG